jgi:hypothetical protein
VLPFLAAGSLLTIAVKYTPKPHCFARHYNAAATNKTIAVILRPIGHHASVARAFITWHQGHADHGRLVNQQQNAI